MRSDIIKLLELHHRIFGVCPNTGNFFRLSEARIFTKKRLGKDWLDQLNIENARLDRREESIAEREQSMRERPRTSGRRRALREAKKIDVVFTPLGLNPDDAQTIFHPVDFIVYNGLNDKYEIKNLILLDRQEKHKTHRALQKSIERAVEKESYEWKTLRIGPDGSMASE